MNIDKISNQNFNGSLIYIAKDGSRHIDDVSTRLPRVYEGFKSHLTALLKKEPCDVYVSRGNQPLKFNIYAADTNNTKTKTKKVTLIPNKLRIYNSNEYYKNPDRFEDAIFDSINDYKVEKIK